MYLFDSEDFNLLKFPQILIFPLLNSFRLLSNKYPLCLLTAISQCIHWSYPFLCVHCLKPVMLVSTEAQECWECGGAGKIWGEHPGPCHDSMSVLWPFCSTFLHYHINLYFWGYQPPNAFRVMAKSALDVSYMGSPLTTDLSWLIGCIGSILLLILLLVCFLGGLSPPCCLKLSVL